MKPQSLPHFGVKNGMIRIGRRVRTEAERKHKSADADGNDIEVVLPAKFRDFVSIGAAKYFMRTGE